MSGLFAAYIITVVQHFFKNVTVAYLRAYRFYLVYDIEKRLKVAKEDYEALIAIYNNKSFSGKITDAVKTKIDTKFSGIKNSILNISEKFVEKLPSPFSKIFELRKSLAKLENLVRHFLQCLCEK